jgi:hypothetical protein
MDNINSSTEFVTIQELVVLSGQSKRTIERKIDRLKEMDSKSYNNLIAHEVATGKGRPRTLYHKEGLLNYLIGTIPKPTKTKAKSISPSRLQFVKEEKKKETDNVAANFDSLDDTTKFTIVSAICEQFEKCNIQLPVACQNMGVTHAQFFRMVTSSPVLFEKWETARRNWLNTHGSMLEFQLYTVLLDKLTPKKKTKQVTIYEMREVLEGEKLVRRPVSMEKRKITEDYVPDTASFMLGKKLLDEIMMLNAANTDPMPEIDNMSLSQLEQLERELQEKARTLGMNT